MAADELASSDNGGEGTARPSHGWASAFAAVVAGGLLALLWYLATHLPPVDDGPGYR